MSIEPIGAEEDLHGGAMRRPRGITVLAILAAIGGVLGLLAALALTLGIGRWDLLGALVVLVVSVAELAFAYSAWTQTPWALKPGPCGPR
jgi:hypothetical protein